ncbi:MAG: hypothetical protein K9H58_19955 [Bacteroidales bacterium]|nr:hypothetical protein [Bacteroidales bacterium]
MKSIVKNSFLVVVTISLIIYSCQKDEDPNNENPVTSNIVYVTDDLTEVTTWYHDSIYVIKAWDFYVENTLTIQAGTIVKFHPDGPDMILGSGGTIIAKGTVASPIIFTSWKDDSAGGDTNGDGGATSPSVKDWGAIDLNDQNGSQFVYCEFHYGGNSSYSATLDVYGNNVKVDHCIFSFNSGDDGSGWYGALDVTYGGPDCVITNNTFFSNVRPLSVNTDFSLDDSNIFHNPLSISTTNTYNGIFVYCLDEITGNLSWGETEVPFVIDDNDLWTYNGGTLTLADLVVLKFRPGSELVLDNGAADIINYNGPGVYFTSYKDDTKKGDTNGDGNATSPSNGDWEGIYDNVNGVMCSWANIFYD